MSARENPESSTAPAIILNLSCQDRIGIVADTSRFLVEQKCNIVDSAQFGDRTNGMFFMRTVFQPLAGAGVAEIAKAFAPIASHYGMKADFYDSARKMPTLIMVSKFGHCLNDLLFRCRIGALPIDVRGIVSNHRDFEDVARAAGIPFHLLPVTPANKAEQEAKISAIVDKEGTELIVLARYMQILSADLCARYSGRIINIHHSFLPSFKGAAPYQQAYARGVKLIGATAHYVTSDLDEGPIIEQSVERVSHSVSAAEYVAVGRDVESVVLARAVKWHAEHRILMNGHRTIIFN